jgi:hypothetical protein
MLLERLQFFNGQRLMASDLQSLDDFNRNMRWLHNQSLHQPGVGSGYAIAGSKGDREVSIQPGYAIDSEGREIVLTETHIEPVPPVANDGAGNSVFFDLAVSFPSDTDLEEAETRDGICVPAGAVRLREAPVFCWIRLDQLTADVQKELESGVRIRLARAEVLNCQLKQPLSLAQRRNARPATLPYVACGSAGADKWAAPKVSAFGIELNMKVDTTDACFRTAPCYMARVAGERQFTVTIGGRQINLLLDGFVNIMHGTVTGFDALMLIPAVLLEQSGISLSQQVAKILPKALKDNGWDLVWIGVEG